MRKAGLGGLGWVTGLMPFRATVSSPVAVISGEKRDFRSVPAFPRQIILNSRTGRGLEERGVPEAFISSNWSSLSLHHLMLPSERRRPEEGTSLGSPTSQPSSGAGTRLHGSALDPQPWGGQGWQRASQGSHPY